MTDRWSGFVVTLEKPLRDDDAAATLAAIQQIRGVVSVKPVVQEPGDMIAFERARHQLWMRMMKILD